MKPLLVGAVSGALALAALAFVPVPSASADTIDSRVGSLTSRPEAPGTGARRLTSATVRQDLYADRVSGTFVLDEVPEGAGTTSSLRINFGTLEGNTCHGEDEYLTDTLNPNGGFTRSGRTITFRRTDSQAGYEDWDCAFALLYVESADEPVRSVLVGALRDVPARADLAVTGVELLGKRKVRLVRGVWTKLDVTVANRGRGDATGTVVTGRGKGVKVRTVRYGTVHDGSTSTEEVQVKLVGKKPVQLRLTVRGGGDTATRTVAVRPVRPPKRPVAGSYRSSDGDVTFSITNGKPRITGFRIRTQTRCGGYPDLPTTTYNTYDFPRVAVGRNGIVDARDRGRLYTVQLELRAVGKRVTSGHFTYSGPARCFASDTFTARRVAR